VEIQLHTFLTSTLDGREWSDSYPGRFTPGTHLYVGPGAGMEMMVMRKNAFTAHRHYREWGFGCPASHCTDGTKPDFETFKKF
jgi:hypothetical protein